MDPSHVTAAIRNGQRVSIRLANTDQWLTANGAMAHDGGGLSVSTVLCGEVVIFELRLFDEIHIDEPRFVDQPDGCAHEICWGCSCACHWSLSRG